MYECQVGLEHKLLKKKKSALDGRAGAQGQPRTQSRVLLCLLAFCGPPCQANGQAYADVAGYRITLKTEAFAQPADPWAMRGRVGACTGVWGAAKLLLLLESTSAKRCSDGP